MAKTMAPINPHPHESVDGCLIFPPNPPQNGSAVHRIQESNVESNDESNGEEVSNDNNRIAFSRGSNQNLVEMDRDLASNPTSNGFNANSSSTSDNSLIQTVISRVMTLFWSVFN